MPKTINYKSLAEKPLSVWDWIVFAVLAVFCFLSFEQGGDILHTGGSSFAYLNGHIFDFYDYNVKHLGLNNYLPTSYILFAIWNIPIQLFGLMKEPSMNPPLAIELWFKLLPTLFYMASAYLMYKIAAEIGMGQNKAKLCAFAFLTMPIGFYSQFMFGQYDSFTVFFMLLGVLFYFRKDWLKFALFFGVALTCKYFPIFIFIPMLLLCEKNIWKIIKYGIIVMLPLALEILIYLPSDTFRKGVFAFGATGYIFKIALSSPYFSISLFLVFWIVLAAAAYFQEADKPGDVVKWSLFYGNIVTFLLFGLSMWHPQWLLFAVPFWVLGTFISKKFDIFMILEVVMMLLFIMFVANIWATDLDQGLFNGGIFRAPLDGRIGAFLSFRDIFPIHNRDILFSAFSGVLLVNALFKHPKFCVDDISEPVDRHWGWARFRFIGGIAIFLVPAVLCLVVAFGSPRVVFDAGRIPAGITGTLVPGRSVEQTFTAGGTSISSVQCIVGTYGRSNDSDLTMKIIDAKTQTALTSVTVNAIDFDDNAYIHIRFDPVVTTVGDTYILAFSSENATEANALTIYYTNTNTTDANGYAVVDGIKQEYDLSVKVFGDK
jgi:hypothetical protein